MITALHISLCILAVYSSTREGMILSRPRAAMHSFMDRIFGVVWSEWLSKPLFDCFVCMASFWTLVLSPVFDVKIIDIPITMLMVCGINTIFSALLKYMRYEEQI
jgi:hypothetical protein